MRRDERETQSDEFAERSARIQQMQADVLLKAADIVLKDVDIAKRRQDIRFAPWILLATGAGAAGALMAAGAALVKLL
jgi:hypothetical protein